MNHYEVSFYPSEQKVTVPEGSTVKDAINASGVDFEFPCGGRGSCGKCRVKILNNPDPPSDREKKHLGEKEIEEGVRLACITSVVRNLEVDLSLGEKAQYNILMASEARAFTIEPLLIKTYVEYSAPSLHDQRSDWKRLNERLPRNSDKDLDIELSVLRKLPAILRESKYYVTAVTDGYSIFGVESSDTTSTMLGMAFDIGTTTIVGYLMDLTTGKELAIASTLNPQVNFGADVVTRISYATQDENSLKKLQAVVVEAIDRLIGEAADKADVHKKDVYAVTIAGNTCMNHLFLGLSPKYIALAPYVPVTSDYMDFNAVDFGIDINPAGRVFAFPNIAGFVGGDTVAVILATEMDKSVDVKLAVDIGTNGEIVLGSSKGMVSCSTAAGPAFEGTQISSGMRGSEGAIDHVNFEGKVNYTVIGGVKPKGICGSGLLDAVACLIRIGIINQRGKILSAEELPNADAQKFAGSLVRYDDANAFILVDESSTEHGRSIMITQNDISSLQLAKGAIATGIRTLIKESDVEIEDIKEVLLAGAFGNYMDPKSACTVGLIPSELECKIKPVGNAAGAGSKLALLSRSEYERTARISSSVRYIELAAHPDFNMTFAKSMRF